MAKIASIWQRQCFEWVLVGCMSAGGVLSGNQAIAQITPDNTLPKNSIVTPQGSSSIITGGTQAGSNLFHSFKEFSVPTGGTAYFNNAADIQNIISRVTGTSISKIDGLIRANGNTNLFVINPNGIIFDANAALDIGGSFFATTASSVKFADGFNFAANASSTTPLLTISVPIGLQLGSNPGEIQVLGNGQGIRTTAELIDTTVGLRVQPNQTLALIGGDLNLEGATLKTAGGRIELGSVTGEGLVNLTPNLKGFSINYNGVPSFGNIQLSKLAAVDASGEGGGDVQVMGKRVTVSSGAQIEASTLGSKPGGALVINALELVEMTGSSPFNPQINSALLTNAYSEAIGSGGNLTINTSMLLVRDGAGASTRTAGAGNAGNLTVNATQGVQLIGTAVDGFPSGLYTSALIGATGAAGDLTINTGMLLVQDGAWVSTATGGANAGNLTVNASDSVQVIGVSKANALPSSLSTSAGLGSTGKGGNLTINTGVLLVLDGAFVITGTGGAGSGGNLLVNAPNGVQLIGTRADGVASRLSTETLTTGTGAAGDLTINTSILQVQDGAEISVATGGAGNGGNLTVNATQGVQLISTRADTFAGNLFALALPGAKGAAGNITINTSELLVRDGAIVITSSAGTGKGGNLTVNASERVKVIGVARDSVPSNLNTVNGRNTAEVAGSLTINTGELLVQDGAVVSTSTIGAGKGGNLTVNASKVQLVGISTNGNPSGLSASASTGAIGAAGNVTINTDELLVEHGAFISAGTFGAGSGGNLTVNASNSVQLIGSSTVNDQVRSGLFTSSQLDATGGAGDITINTGELLIRDRAAVSVQGLGTGNAGNLEVNARSIRLENFGILTADTYSINTDPNLEQATINLRSQNLVLLGGSRIATDASGTNVIGGNINIDTGLLAAFGNSDITANSTDFRGGRVQIKAQGILGTQSRNLLTPASDITATGATPQLSGTIELNSFSIDPTRSLVQLPVKIVDVSRLIEQNLCVASLDSEFIITGRGGLPNSPGQTLLPDAGWEDWRILKDNEQPLVSAVSSQQDHEFSKIKDDQHRIVEATGWIVDSDGNVILTANPVTVAPDSFWSRLPDCQTININRPTTNHTHQS